MEIGVQTVRRLFLVLVGCVILAGQASAQSNKLNFRIGDVVANPNTSGGCPTFEGLLDVLSAAERNQSARSAMIRNQCRSLDPGTNVVVVDRLMGNIMRVEPPGNPGQERLFVEATGFVRQRVSQGQTSARLVDAKIGELYSRARKRLVSQGHRPFVDRTADEQRCGYRPEICGSYSEAESCSNTGRAYCVFNWITSDNRRLSITTYGEQFERLTIAAIDRTGESR